MLGLTRIDTCYSCDALPSLMKKRDWKKVQKIVSANKGISMSCNSRCCKTCKRAHSPLSIACRFNPDDKVVSTLLKADASAATEVDCLNRFPLHVACEYGASPEVIRKLLATNKYAVSKKDTHGMLPLHLLLRYYSRNSNIHVPEQKVNESILSILKDLLDAEPSAILQEDSEGVCPIEHAVVSGLNLDILNELIKRSQCEQFHKSV